MNYTKAQHRAVFYPDGNLLLSAAAGSGKTAALTGRITELVTSGRAEISEMLIVTFTKAAAAEMKTRISKKLREKIAEYAKAGDSGTVSRLSRALSQLPSADISTIHSFLYKSLKPYFPMLNLSQDSSIMEEREIDAIKGEIMRDTVDDFFEKSSADDAGFIGLADTIGQARDTEAIDRELLWLASKLSEAGQPVSVLTDFADALEKSAAEDADPFRTPFGMRIIRELASFSSYYTSVFASLADELAADPFIGEKYGPELDRIVSWLGGLDEILSENPSYTAAAVHFAAYAQDRLPSVKKDKTTETSELFKKFRADLKSDIEDIAADFFVSTPEQFRRAAGKTAKILRSAYTVIEEYRRRLTKKKRAFSILEYADLEACATELFIGKDGEVTPEAREVGSAYKYVFIDEYQDTNRVQDNIFRAVSGNAVRFMVGDIKQSIYRFRGADPRVFSDYRRMWGKASLEGDITDPDGASIFMSENFRCSEDIIRFINAVSDTILPYGSVPYENDDALIYAKGDAAPPVPAEIILIDKKAAPDEIEGDGTADDTSEDNASDENCEAAYVAGRIREMIGRYAPDGSVIKPSDIAILLRSPGSAGESYRRALEKAAIPVRTKTSKPLGDFPSVMLLVCLLRFIDNPLRDISTAGIMKSSLFGFTVEDIISLRQYAGELPLYTAVLDLAGGICVDGDEGADSALIEKCTKLHLFLEEEKTRLGGVSAAKYLENLLASTDFLRLEEIRGKSAETDAVMKTVTLARSFDRSRRDRSLSAFIDYLGDYLEGDTDTSSDDEPDAVSIMSIHASKGLEFPVVFLCECAKRRNDQDERRTVLFDDELGFGMQLPDETGLVKCDNLIRRSIAAKMAEDAKEEEMRMLYVALTRAKSKLIVTAKVSYADRWIEEKRSRSEFIGGWAVKKASSYIDWIAMAAVRSPSRSWEISVLPAGNIECSESGISERESVLTEPNTALLEELAARTQFVYPFDFLENIPSKLIVSRLEPEILDEESVSEKISSLTADISRTDTHDEVRQAKRPAFMTGGENIRADEIGSATHRFMQFADFGNIDAHGWEYELDRLTREKYLSPRDSEIVSRRQLEGFRSSALFCELLRSPMVKREFRFNVLMDAARFTADAELCRKLSENGVKITVQGVVDCVYRSPETGKLILIDYKTDSIRPDEWKDIKKAEQRLAERHRNQLTYYAEICAGLFGEEIAETHIYSTVLGRNIRII